jgi:hypothetical protein
MQSWTDFTWRRVSFALVVLGMALATSAILKKSVTVDEFQALPSGLAVLQTGDFRYPIGTPPLSQILPAIPAWIAGVKVPPPTFGPGAAWAVAHAFANSDAPAFHRYFLFARLVSLSALLATMLLALALATRLYGARAATLAVACLALNPTFLAHGALVTPDIYLAAAMALFLLLLDRYAELPTLRRAALLGAALGIACLAKFTAVLLFPLLPLLFYLVGVKRCARATLLAWVGALVMIHAGYAFQEPFGATVPWLPAWIPLPLPLPAQFMREALDQLHEGTYPSYLFHRFSERGFFQYYLVAILVKTPAGLLALAALACTGPLRPRERPLAVLTPFYFAFFSLARYKNLGIRYLLFLYPWVAVFSARVKLKEPWRKRIVATALACTAAGAALAWPDYIAYFNLPSGGPSFGHTYLLESNLDWGQDLTTLKDFMDERGITEISLAHFGQVDPALYGIRSTLLNGRPANRYVAISANFLWGRSYFVNGTTFYPATMTGYQAYQGVAPLAVLGHSIYVYDSETIPQLAHSNIGGDPERRPQKNSAHE